MELRLIIVAFLMLCGAFLVFMNCACVLASMRNKRRGINTFHSVVPLISLIPTGLAYVICPLEPRIWLWVIPAVDPGNVFLVIGLPVEIIRQVFRKKGNGAGQAHPPES